MPKKMQLSDADKAKIQRAAQDQADAIQRANDEFKPVTNMHNAAELVKVTYGEDFEGMTDQRIVEFSVEQGGVFTNDVEEYTQFSDKEHEALETLPDSGTIPEKVILKDTNNDNKLFVLDLSGSQCCSSGLQVSDLPESDRWIINEFSHQWVINNIRTLNNDGNKYGFDFEVKTAATAKEQVKYQELVIRFLNDILPTFAVDRKPGKYDFANELGKEALTTPIIFRTVESQDLEVLRIDPNSPQAQSILGKYNFPETYLTQSAFSLIRHKYKPTIIYTDCKGSIDNVNYAKQAIVQTFKTYFKPSVFSTPVLKTVEHINTNIGLHIKPYFDGDPDDRAKAREFTHSFEDVFGQMQRATIKLPPSLIKLFEVSKNGSLCISIIGNEPNATGFLNVMDQLPGVVVRDDVSSELCGQRAVQGNCFFESDMTYVISVLANPNTHPMLDMPDEYVLPFDFFNARNGTQASKDDYLNYLKQAPGRLHPKLLAEGRYCIQSNEPAENLDITDVLKHHLGTQLLMQQGPSMPETLTKLRNIQNKKLGRIPLSTAEYIALTQIDLTQQELNNYQDPDNPEKVHWTNFDADRQSHQRKSILEQIVSIFGNNSYTSHIASQIDIYRFENSSGAGGSGSMASLNAGMQSLSMHQPHQHYNPNNGQPQFNTGYPQPPMNNQYGGGYGQQQPQQYGDYANPSSAPPPYSSGQYGGHQSSPQSTNSYNSQQDRGGVKYPESRGTSRNIFRR